MFSNITAIIITYRFSSTRRKKILPSSIQISEELLNEAKKVGATNARSLSDQIEWWARMSKCVEDNPDLTYSQIKEILMGKEELDRGEKTEYTFG